jgi:uncharacterized protein (TIGR00255 family)
MTISSMTGFARAGGSVGDYNWIWEIKSVNGRGLDIRCKLPAEHRTREPLVRAAVPERFHRGSITINLDINEPGKRVRLRIDHEALTRIVSLQKEIQKVTEVLPPTLDELRKFHGVIEETEERENPAEQERIDAAIAASLEKALNALAAMRAAEGKSIASVLRGMLRGLDALRKDAESCASVQPRLIQERLRTQVKRLLNEVPLPPEDRLAQETALLITKADVREELDRLKAHLKAARTLLRDGGAIGRRLDFLCQELMREANTLCSKSADMKLTGIGLELKAKIEQFREQIQNIE